ncbi:MAG TPA: DUF3052 family protein [Chloroflexota bacterium]|nr:DUF3052 family protein [Chloroflexota bacterium]
MGQEEKVAARIGGRRTEGKVLLETDEIVFRGEPRLKIPLASIKEVTAGADGLRVRWTDGDAHFALDPKVAARWAKRIANPPTLLDKLGIKAGQRILLVGAHDTGFARALEQAGADVAATARADNDVIFVEASSRADLAQLVNVQKHLKRDGAIWVIRPKGVQAVTEADVLNEGKRAGLVDVKVARFSETHTAEKFVIPVARR